MHGGWSLGARSLPCRQPDIRKSESRQALSPRFRFSFLDGFLGHRFECRILDEVGHHYWMNDVNSGNIAPLVNNDITPGRLVPRLRCLAAQSNAIRSC